MQTTSNAITYTAAAEAPRPSSLRLTLEPERIDKRANAATLADLSAMIVGARGGLTARNRQARRCKWASFAANGDLIVTLKLMVWPSDLDLAYSLTLPSGVTSSAPIADAARRDRKFPVAGSGEVELPWLLQAEASESCVWHPAIGVWDAWSRPIEPPVIRRDRTRLVLEGESEAYGVLHVRGVAVGYRHNLSIRYPTGSGPGTPRRNIFQERLYVAGGDSSADGPAISVSSAENFEVTATWTDEHGETRTETATMTIPDCARAFLAECPEGGGEGGESFILHDKSDEGEGTVTVYYNACNGSVLEVRFK